MRNKYYLVEAMCGHVGRNNYIPITFAVKAYNGKEAARIIRYAPRVKHHKKNAIFSVREVCFEEYLIQFRINKEDQFLNWRNCKNDVDYDECAIQERAKTMESLLEFSDEEMEEKPKRREQRREKMHVQKEIEDDLVFYESSNLMN